jgi:hypothetical protein
MWNYSAQKIKKNMTSERIKQIQEETAYPESVSVQQALLQVWNECQQEINEKIEQKVEEYRQRYVSISEEKEIEYEKLLIAERQYIAVIDVIKFINKAQ